MSRVWRIHFKRLQARGSGGRKLKLEAFPIVPVSGDETLNQGSAGKAGGADFLLSPSSIECISFFPFCLSFSLQPLKSPKLSEVII